MKISRKKRSLFLPFFPFYHPLDPINADDGIVFDIQTLSAVITNFGRIEIAHLTLHASDAIAII